ncbi:hypothetical protein J6590_003989 [Homalodisca vitripennis]|nr:hypothetical protein J6590_003989 [Homalodisca vitripennis]
MSSTISHLDKYRYRSSAAGAVLFRWREEALCRPMRCLLRSTHGCGSGICWRLGGSLMLGCLSETRKFTYARVSVGDSEVHLYSDVCRSLGGSVMLGFRVRVTHTCH